MIDAFRSYLPRHQATAPAISAWSVGQHIHHCYLATNTVIAEMQAPKSEPYRYQFSIPRLFCFTLGTIPRGKGKAPQAVIPTDTPTLEQLTRELDQSDALTARYDALPRDAYWRHPVFGRLNKPLNDRLTTIHNHHHIKIIKDILARA